MSEKYVPGEVAFAASEFVKEQEYWLGKLTPGFEKSVFPGDILSSGPDPAPSRLETLDFTFREELAFRLIKSGNNSDPRLFMILTAGLFLLLNKYTGKEDIILGAPIAKQKQEGDFLNTILALRSPVEGTLTFRELLQQVRQTIVEASENQNYPLETIPYKLNLPVADHEFPLFDTAILLENIHHEHYIRHLPLKIIFSILRAGGQLSGKLRYDPTGYGRERVRQMVSHYTCLLENALSDVNQPLSRVSVLPEPEKQRILYDFNATAANYPGDKTIPELFAAQVEQTPGALALEQNGRQFSYGELNREANRLARVLREKGIEPGTPVGILLENSKEVVLGIMAVLKAGGTYVPMGYEYPEERVQYVLNDSGSRLLITGKSLVKEMQLECPVLELESGEPLSGPPGASNLEPLPSPGDLAYIMYTSGTTGKPKGVMVEQRSLVNYLWWAARTYVKGEKLNFPLYTSISFDLTVTSLFTPLITGNAVVVYGGTQREIYLEKVIDDHKVGVVKLTPSHLKLIRNKPVVNSTIKRLVVGGEALETQLAAEIHENFAGKVEIYNEYGPTETVVGCMIYRFDPVTDHGLTVPIGKPADNTQVYLLDRNLNAVPVGVTGEIFISGDGVARGYVKKPDLTAEKFLPNPFIPGRRMYRSGDLARRSADGNIEFLGRIDQQVKIRGNRIEPGEIENKILRYQEETTPKPFIPEDLVEKCNLKDVKRCVRCLIPENYPGSHLDHEGVCNFCRQFETHQEETRHYFKTPLDFLELIETAKKHQSPNAAYDCLLLYSGGKDSSYVLHRLVEMGLRVMAITFDNGYISKTAFKNIKRTTSLLKVDSLVLSAENMKDIYVESLRSEHMVCNGCFKAVNTLGTKIALDHDINLVISGLSRGQINDIKLHGLFQLGIFTEQEIEEKLLLFRKEYHSPSHRISRLLGIEFTDHMLENLYFADFFRYDDISIRRIYEYLKVKDRGWVVPADTGLSSSNCVINDVGIYVHLKDKGYHYYAAQLSWDIRLGSLTREEGLEEITGFRMGLDTVNQVLEEIGYFKQYIGAAVVDRKDDRGDQYLCAYVKAAKESDMTGLRTYLSGQLPDYMIPTYFVPMDEIPLTANGKIDRTALPEPEAKPGGQYAAPRDETEKKLVTIWGKLLGIPEKNLGIDASFFEVGGHSLRATFLISEIHKEFNVKVPLTEIFRSPIIRELAQYLQQAVGEQFVSIAKAPLRDYYKASSVQKRLYFLQQIDTANKSYNILEVVAFEGDLGKNRLAGIFQQLIRRHESFRTSFALQDGDVVQRIAGEVAFNLVHLEAEDDPRVIQDIIDDFGQPFDLSRAPLLRAGWLELGDHRCLMVVNMHHIIFDGVSLGVFVEEFMDLYAGKELPEVKLQYKDFSQWQNSAQQQEAIKMQKEYWLREFSDEVPLLQLPTDFPRAEVNTFAGDVLDFALTAEETRALEGLASAEGATMYMVILAIYNVFLSKLSGQEDIVVGASAAGRTHEELHRVIGMFVNALALRNYPEGEKTFIQLLREVKARTTAAFENQDLLFEELVEAAAVERHPNRNPLFDVMFVLNNMEIREVNIPGLKLTPYPHRTRSAQMDLKLRGEQQDGILALKFEYSTTLFKPDTMATFARNFKEIAAKILENVHIKLKEIPISYELAEAESKIALEQVDFGF